MNGSQAAIADQPYQQRAASWHKTYPSEKLIAVQVLPTRSPLPHHQVSYEVENQFQ
jgi:hypothetical protein